MMHEPRQILTTGVPVLTADGRRGRLHQALLSPGHCRLHALVVRYGMLPPRDVVVPIEQVAAITDTHMLLRLSHSELAQLPAYQSVWRLTVRRSIVCRTIGQIVKSRSTWIRSYGTMRWFAGLNIARSM